MLSGFVVRNASCEMPVLPKAKGTAVCLLSTTARWFFAVFGICNTKPRLGFRGAGEKGDSTLTALLPP